MKNLIEGLQNLGLSEKAAKVYLAALELGEATVLQLAHSSGEKRTSIYYILEELIKIGALIETRHRKKTYYMPEEPAVLLKRAQDKLSAASEMLSALENLHGRAFNRPRVYFLFGTTGFKKVWNMIFASKNHEYQIITQGEDFLDYVREKYILEEIIATKKKNKVWSRQLITDSPYARRLTEKDFKENRRSKFLPSTTKLPFTEIISDKLVAFISPRFENAILVIENELFARTRRQLFDATWDILPEQKKI